VEVLPPAEGVAEVSAGEARHGRRDNGLVAAEYAAAGDVDPRVGEHLLDVLALDGIAAYLRPSTDLHPVTRSSTLLGRPTDRLYVDRSHLATARDYLTRLAEEPEQNAGSPPFESSTREAFSGAARPDSADTRPGATNVDDEWAKIVAGFDLEPDGHRKVWPDAEDLPEGSRSEPGTTILPARTGPVSPPRPEPERSLLDGLDTFGADLADPDDEEGYNPPPPPPVPRPSAPTAFAIAGIVLGLIVFLKPTLLPMAESVAMLTGFTAVVGGFATLVWRLRPGDDDDDIDPDQGAKV
jgi:hypothetical protein